MELNSRNSKKWLALYTFCISIIILSSLSVFELPKQPEFGYFFLYLWLFIKLY